MKERLTPANRMAKVTGKNIGIVTERNIWGGETLEWTIETPPTHENFDELPLITGTPYEYKLNDSEEIPEEINL